MPLFFGTKVHRSEIRACANQLSSYFKLNPQQAGLCYPPKLTNPGQLSNILPFYTAYVIHFIKQVYVACKKTESLDKADLSSALDYYIMNCQHGEKITKFCISVDCRNKESAGCEYCIRKYHFHLSDTGLLLEDEAASLVKMLTLPTDIKYRARNLKEAAVDYLKQVKHSLNYWVEQAQKSISDGLSHATLYRRGLLSTYEHLRQRQYRKINAKQLKAVNEYARSVSADAFKKQELRRYYEEVEWTLKITAAAQEVVRQIAKLPQVRINQKKLQEPSRVKVSEIYQSIRQEKDKREKMMSFQKASHNKELALELNSMLKQVETYQKVENKQSCDKSKSKEASQPIFNNLIYNEETQKRLNNLNNEQQESLPKKERETAEDRRKRLRRRRSSIDEKLDFKFTATIEEKVRSAKKEQGKNGQQQEQSLGLRLGRIRIQSEKNTELKGQNQKEKVKQGSFIGELVDSNKIKESEDEKAQEPKIANFSKDQSNKILENDKSEVSSNKSSELNFTGMLDLLIDNILPPLPSPTPKTTTDEPIFQKVIKIPVANQTTDDLWSPIYKSINRQHKNLGTGHSALVAQNDDKVQDRLEKQEQRQIWLFSIDEKPQQQGSATAISKNTSQVAGQQQSDKSSEKQGQKQDLIHLQRNQKNSLLLFCQALKSPADRAIELLIAALKYSPQNLSAAEYLSYFYVENQMAKECLQVCQGILKYLKDSPQEFELSLHLHNNKAAALNLLGRYSESILILQKCLRYRKKPYFFKNIADAYFNLGIHEKAIMYYEKAIIMDSHYDQAFYNLAVTQFFQEQYNSTQLNIRKALEIQPINQVYIELGKQVERRIQNLMI